MSDSPFGNPAQDDDEFETELPEDEGFAIPEGDYPAVCTSLEKGLSSSGNPMWTWDFKVTNGQYEGREFRLFTALTAAAMWKVRETLEALGLGKGGATAKFKKSDAIGRLCVISLVPDEYKGVKRSSIQKVSPPTKGAGARYSAPAGDRPPTDEDVPF